MKTGFYLYTERLDRNRNRSVAGVTRVAKRIKALGECDYRSGIGMRGGGLGLRQLIPTECFLPLSMTNAAGINTVIA
jgi:hypothetical protein